MFCPPDARLACWGWGGCADVADREGVMPSPHHWLREWLGLEPLPVPSASPSPPAEEPGIALESVRLIAEVVTREYANENELQKGLDTKTATWIGATGAVLIFAIGTLGKIPVAGSLLGGHARFALAYVASLGVAIGLLVLAEVWFVRAFTLRLYLRLNPQEWATFEQARKRPLDAYIQLAGEYNSIVQQNRAISKEKVALQQWGVGFFLGGLAILLVVLGLNLLATW